MARYFVPLTVWDPDLSSTGQSYAQGDARVLILRDQIRSVLDTDGLHTNWMVSDIAKWSGSSSYQGYAFTVFHRQGGVNSGPAWTFFIPGPNNSTGVSYVSNILQSTYTTLFKTTIGGNATNTRGTPLIHYAAQGGTTNLYDFGYSLVDGTLLGGDFDPPTTSPYTNLAGFLPSGTLPGVSLYTMSTGYSKVSHVIVADDVTPALAYYHTLGVDYGPATKTLIGEIVVPYQPTDTFKSGIVSTTDTYNTSQEGQRSGDSIWVFDETGSVVQVADYGDTYFTETNVPLSDGSFPWDVVSLASASLFKGWVDSNVLRIMGPLNQRLNSLYEAGTYIKLDQKYCWLYAENSPIWPTSPGSRLYTL